MKKLTLKEIESAVFGKINSIDYYDIKVRGISTDTREELTGKLFIPLVGDNFDGHNYLDMAFDKGTICVLSEKNLETERPFIKVKSTKQALMDLAEYYRSLFDIKVVAVTGSSGKTTTKDLIASVLNQKYSVLKTSGNFNNEIGVPKMIFELTDDIEVAVLETGMNHFGEINNLSKIIKPNVCVITNIGTSHIEYLGSRQGILKAKTEIFNFMPEDSLKILNGDDDLLKTVKVSGSIFYGLDSKNEVYSENIISNQLDGESFDIVFKDGPKIPVQISKPGTHMILNSLAAACVGKNLGLTESEIQNGLASFELTGMRMEITKTKKYTIINDVYNANPESMKAAIDVLSNSNSKKVCILGDMLELGNFSDKLHFELGKYLATKNIDTVVCVGEKAYNIFLGVTENNKKPNYLYFKNKDELIENKNKFLSGNETVLVKASRGMKFEQITEILLQE